MRHLVRGRKLGRTASHRKATLMALSVALIKHERIVTTMAKAKELRRYVEPIITRAKEDSTHNRSHVFRHLRDNKATSRLFDEIAPMVESRPGGYTRIIKLGLRPGDGAEKVIIELVDFNDAKPESASRKKRRTRRAGGGKTKKAVDAAPTAETRKTAKKAGGKKVVEEEPQQPADAHVTDPEVDDLPSEEVQEAAVEATADQSAEEVSSEENREEAEAPESPAEEQESTDEDKQEEKK
jgi:large subunit ribosomal protein L17